MTAVLVVPTAPALLPGVAPGPPMDVPDEWAAFRRRVDEVLVAAADATVVLSLVAGPRTTVSNGGVVDLRAYGVPGLRSTHRGHHDVAAMLHDGLGRPTASSNDATPRILPLDAAVHVLLAATQGIRGVITVEVGSGPHDELVAALDAALPHDEVVVLVQGDLASSPIRRSDSDRGREATAWDESAVPLLQSGDLDAWRRLGPGDVEPRGLQPLTVAMAWLGDRWDGGALRWEAPRGIGAVSGRVGVAS